MNLLKFLCCLMFTTSVFADHFVVEEHKIQYKVFSPQSHTPIKADFLYLHGLGDSFQNHKALFKELTDNGIKVIAFDFPEHGQSEGIINHFSFFNLSYMAKVAERLGKTSDATPLFVGGQSIGGLLAIRMIQGGELLQLSRPIKAALLYAPAVSVQKCAGNILCQISNETLTNNSSLWQRRLWPTNVLKSPLFAAEIYSQSVKAQRNHADMAGVDSLIFIAGKEDRYINSDKVMEWAREIRRSRNAAELTGVECKNARHELDNEPESYGGQAVREFSAQYILSKLGEKLTSKSVSPCRFF